MASAWLAAAAAAVLVAGTSALGPTLVMMGARRGAQAGDLAFTAAVAGGAALVTRRVWPLSRSEVRVLMAGAAWLLAGCVSLYLAATTEIGPAVLALNDQHGVHSGDVAVTAAAAGTAALVTLALLGRRRQR